MAYNRKNYYKRIIDIQNLVLELQKRNPDISMKEIYEHYVSLRWHISRRTFSNYLSVNAKKELNRIERVKEPDPNQLSLF